MTRLVFVVLAVFGGATAIACGGGSVGPPSPGNFGTAELSPECGALARACLSRGLDSPIAVGSQLGVGVTFDINGTSGVPASLQTSDPAVLTTAEGVVSAETPGVAVLLIRGPDQRVLDFIHLWTAAAEELRLVRYTDDAEPFGVLGAGGALLAGDELLVNTEAFAGNQPLIGLFPTEWTVEELVPSATGEPVVAVIDDLVFGLSRVVARTPGRARLTASALGLETAIELEVLP